MAEKDGLFELDGSFYTLKFNMNKIKAVETMLSTSFMAELQRNNGVLSFRMLEALFAVGLHDVNDEKAVKGKKATDIYNQLLHDVGLGDLMGITVGKLEEDLAFLFRGN